MNKIGVIIVAGGSGTRMGGNIPKQFMELDGKPLLMRSIEKFHSVFPEAEIVVVLPGTQVEVWNLFLKQYDFRIPHSVAEGGDTRFDSVKNGLESLVDCDYVGIHDGVRPLVTREVILAALNAAEETGAAVPVVPVVDSLREIEDGGSHIVDRSRFVAVQTPQFLRADVIKEAYGQSYSPVFTDDASVAEACGYRVALSQGDPANIKITTPSDMVAAMALLAEG